MVYRFTFALAVFLGSILAPFAAHGWEAEVAQVIDGDSIVVLRADTGEKETIRLYGIDCPEYGQRFGDEATALTRPLALRKKVGIVALDKDPYDRTVGAVVRLDNGVTLQDELLRAGLAWVDPRYCKGCKPWRAMQRAAAKGKTGLWRDDEPTAPWKWRKEKGAVVRKGM